MFLFFIKPNTGEMFYSLHITSFWVSNLGYCCHRGQTKTSTSCSILRWWLEEDVLFISWKWSRAEMVNAFHAVAFRWYSLRRFSLRAQEVTCFRSQLYRLRVLAKIVLSLRDVPLQVLILITFLSPKKLSSKGSVPFVDQHAKFLVL